MYAVKAEFINNRQYNENKGLPPLTFNLSPYKGMMNIGTRPTVDGTKSVIEVNIFDFDADIYGATVRVYLKKYLRGELKFSGLDALKAQLAADRINAIHHLAE